MRFLRRLREIAVKVRRRNVHLFPAARLLSLLLVGVAFIDVISTNAALAAGHSEANAIVNYVQDRLGSWWAVPKIGLHVILALLILWYPSRKMVSMARVVVGGYLALVFNNFYFAGWIV